MNTVKENATAFLAIWSGRISVYNTGPHIKIVRMWLQRNDIDASDQMAEKIKAYGTDNGWWDVPAPPLDPAMERELDAMDELEKKRGGIESEMHRRHPEK